ncbi:MAG: thioredoxin domain-containing protein [Chloroflexota bacterium]|nr:thioredoxin domain-containing protein [Chloroflexota bacterium]
MANSRQQRRRGGRQQPSSSSKRLIYLLIGGGVLVAAAVAVIVFAAIGTDSSSDSTVPAAAEAEPASAPTDAETGQVATQEDSVPKLPTVTLEEFADFQCSHCMQFALGIGKQIKEDFVETDNIRFIFRHFPFIGPESFRAAEATECAADQNKFWEYHDTVFENWKGVNEGHFSDDNLKLFADSLQLDRGAFDACFDSRKYLGKVESDIRRGEQLGVRGTPSLFLNGEMLTPSSNEELVQLIESAIAAAQ